MDIPFFTPDHLKQSIKNAKGKNKTGDQK